MKRMGRRRLNDWFSLVVAEPDFVEKFSNRALEAMDHGALWSLASAYQRYLTPTADPGIAKQPALGIWGKQDKSHSSESWNSAAGLANSVELITLDEVGHFPELEATDRVAELITDFSS